VVALGRGAHPKKGRGGGTAYPRQCLRRALLGTCAIAVVAALAAGCGKPQPAAGSPAVAQFTTILGHAPTGLALRIAQQGEMVVANDADYAPFSWLNDQHHMVGFDVDVAAATAGVLKLRLRQVQPGWDTIPLGLKTGRWDVCISSMTPTAGRKKALSFTRAYYWAPRQVLVLKGHPAIGNAADMMGKTIGCAAQTAAATYLGGLAGVRVRTYTSDLDGMPDLKSGRLDGLIMSMPVEMRLIAAGEPVQISGPPLWYEAAAFSVRQDEADWVAVLDWAVRTLRQDGTLARYSTADVYGVDLTKAPPAGAKVIGGRQ
jgi:polar amino acid transport system substrate-binding protein